MNTAADFLRTALPLALVMAACDSDRRAGPPPDAPPATDATLLVTGGGLSFAPAPVLACDVDSPDYEVLPEEPLQALLGFGGAFNEKGWEALGFLPEAQRTEILDRLFSPDKGLNLNLCRVPIGASDYALSRYTEDDGPEDLAMERFSIERDRQALLPYIRAAQVRNPTMRFWASAWTPPPWMKTNNDYNSGSMRDEPAVYAAYALYLARFVEEYAKEGVAVESVAVQNEPEIENGYPSCGWEPSQFRTFVRDHLGPTLQQRLPSTTVLLGTFNDPHNERHATEVLKDPAAQPFVRALGVQWNGLPIAKAARAIVPGLPIWHTETDCGNHYWDSGFNPDWPPNDWNYARFTWRKMRDYLTGGAELYTLWNLVLDETGKSIDTTRVWPQNSPIVVDRATQTATLTPMYYAVAHITRYSGAGAVVLRGQGDGEALAFRRPDGSFAIAMVNPSSYPDGLRIKIGGRAYYAELPAYGFGTLLVAP